MQVNRIWQHHFGVGLVTTSDNLGVSGAAPSHPELLDDLASRFIASGWSTKALHRSDPRVGRLSPVEARWCRTAFAIDPDDRLLWRFRVTRLDAEALRDAMLAASGGLDRSFGGPYVPTVRDDTGEVLVKSVRRGANRRSLYLQQRRTQTLSLLTVFDAPSITVNCVQRPASTMPLQSLGLLNSQFVVAQAERFAERLARELPRAGSAGCASLSRRAVACAIGRRIARGGRVHRRSACPLRTGRQRGNARLGRFLPDAVGEQLVFVRRVNDADRSRTI